MDGRAQDAVKNYMKENYNVNKDVQIEHLKKAQKTVESFGFPVEIVLLWVDSDWTTIEKI